MGTRVLCPLAHRSRILVPESVNLWSAVLLGIDTIVGRDYVSYSPDGSYALTSPAAMMRWIGCVAGVGLLGAFAGITLLVRATTRECQQPSRVDSAERGGAEP